VVHNFGRSTEIAIDPPAWSVATEWQLYLLLPLLLLPLWRTFGARVTVLVALAAGIAVHHWFPALDSVHPWYLGLFAMGMAAAWVSARGVRVPALGWVAAGSLAVVGAGLVHWLRLVNHLQVLSETALGAALALLLAWLARRSLAGRPTLVHRALESRLPVWLGLWSFSMYLVHDPLLNLGNLLLLRVPMGIGTRFALELLFVLPLALAIAYLFHRVVERRFLTSHQRATEAAVHSEDTGEPVLSDRPRRAVVLPAADITVR
jgi:peptidoglycan/LPS O-acetylase OafA/YrhL